MRIVEYNDKFMYIKDVSYKNGICEVSIYNVNNKETYFGEGNKIIKTINEKRGVYSYVLVDKDEWENYGSDRMHIFSIYIENN